MVRALCASSTMTHSPPVDQRIVDEYFQLASKRSLKDVAWLYGMVATFGVTAEHFRTNGWHWEGNSIVFHNRKRPIQPIHPQWMLLFQLKEKEPQWHWSSKIFDGICADLYQAMAHQRIKLNVTDLVLAHRLRKNYYKTLKHKKEVPAFAAVS